jgi:nitrogen regulatory protein P-II 1
MKMIVAIVQPSKLNKIKKLLYKNKINRFVVNDCYGHSDEDSIIETYRGVEMEIDLKKKIRLQIAVNDDFVDTTVNAILEGGKTGKIGDGKIFVFPIEKCYRIATGEEGEISIN